MLGVRVALIGRNSRCKSLFSKAASSSDKRLPDTASDTEVWWTSPLAPREADLAQSPEHGFAPSGERLLPAQLNHASAASVLGEESTQGDGDGCEPPVADAARPGAGEATPAVLVVVGAEVAFHKGYPRPNRGGVTPVKAAVSRVRERLGGGQVPLAVAVSVDVEWDGGPSQSTAIKAFLESAKDEMALEGVPAVAVSPRTELWLREQESEGGRVSYRRGDSQFRVGYCVVNRPMLFFLTSLSLSPVLGSQTCALVSSCCVISVCMRCDISLQYGRRTCRTFFFVVANVPQLFHSQDCRVMFSPFRAPRQGRNMGTEMLLFRPN